MKKNPVKAWKVLSTFALATMILTATGGTAKANEEAEEKLTTTDVVEVEETKAIEEVKTETEGVRLPPNAVEVLDVIENNKAYTIEQIRNRAYFKDTEDEHVVNLYKYGIIDGVNKYTYNVEGTFNHSHLAKIAHKVLGFSHDDYAKFEGETYNERMLKEFVIDNYYGDNANEYLKETVTVKNLTEIMSYVIQYKTGEIQKVEHEELFGNKSIFYELDRLEAAQAINKMLVGNGIISGNN